MKNLVISNNLIHNLSKDGILIDNSAGGSFNNAAIIGNVITAVRYGIRLITAGNILISSNNLLGATTGFINGATGSDFAVNNLGYNPQAVSSNTAGASPFTTT